ncbi:MAG: TetR/AcrR family transcriptional regulator [Clostridiales bacterium]|nr:TetR/AcrR family transcriptional regulator [Clostridiales bacterium]
MNPKTSKSEATKMRIFQSAKKLFQQKGFEATSVREIVEDAGCAKGTFYLYFETKVDLLLYLTNFYFENINELIAKELSFMTDDPFAQIDNIFHILSLFVKERGISLSIFHTNEILGIITEQKVNDNFVNKIISHLSSFLDEGIKRKFFRPLDSHLYGKIIFSFCHQQLESVMLYKYPADIETVSKELSIIIRKILERR